MRKLKEKKGQSSVATNQDKVKGCRLLRLLRLNPDGTVKVDPELNWDYQ